MAQYSYTYRTISAYNTSNVRSETASGPVTKPFAPFVPKLNGNGNSDGCVTNKKIVPISSRPSGYGEESDDDHEWKHQQTSPVRGSPRKLDEFLTKVQNEASHPPRSTHVTSPDWRHSSHPKPFADYGSTKPIGGATNNDKHDGYHNGTNYGNTGGIKPFSVMNKREGCNNGTNDVRKPIESTIRDHGDYGINQEGRKPIGGANNHDGYNGYGGDYGNYGNKEGRNLIESPVKKDNYDGYNGYGGYGDNNKEGSKLKPTSSPTYNNGYGGDYGNYGNKEGRNLIENPVKKDNYDGYGGYGNYNNKEGPNPNPKPTSSPTYNNGYGGNHSNYGNKEGPKPTSSPTYNNGYGDGYRDYNNKEGPKFKPTSSPTYNNGYGDYGTGNGSDKDRGKPFGSASPTQRDNYDHENDYGEYGYNNKEGYKPAGSGGGPKVTSSWTASPRKGVQLSKPINDIGEAMRLLESEAARLNVNGRGYNGGPKPNEHDGPGPLASRPAPPASKHDKAMDLVNETERLKKIVTGPPPQIQARSSVPVSVSVPVKNETRPNGNFNFVPTRPRFNLVDGRGPNYDTRRGYGVMDHKQAEKKFNGMTI